MSARRALLVTGASGQFGRRLLPALRAMGWAEIRLLVHRRPAPPGDERAVAGSLDDPASLAAAAAGIDTVLHLAAVTHSHDPAIYERVNRDGTARLVEACRGAGVRRFVFVSSRAATPDGGAYARSKWEAEEALGAAAGAKMRWLVLAPAEVYGPGSRDAVERLLNWVRRCPVVPLVGADDTRLAPVHAADVEAGLLRALAESDLHGHRYVLAGPEEMTPRDLVRRAGAALGVRRHSAAVPWWLLRCAARACRALGSTAIVADQIERLRSPKPASIDEARRDLGFAPRRLEDALHPAR